MKENLFANVSITDQNYIPIRNYAFDVNKISLKEFMKIESNALQSISGPDVLQLFFSKYLGLIVTGKN